MSAAWEGPTGRAWCRSQLLSLWPSEPLSGPYGRCGRAVIPAQTYNKFIVLQLSGTTERPRMAVYKSNEHIYVQVRL